MIEALVIAALICIVPMNVLAAQLPAYHLAWHPVPNVDYYTLEKATGLYPTVWSNDTLCSESYACSVRTYTPPAGVVEQWHVKAHNEWGSTFSMYYWTMLTLDWSSGVINYSTFNGNGSMDGTLVKVMLPSERWTVTYGFQEAIPVWVQAKCDHDYNRDDIVNLSDFITFGTWWVANGRPLNEFANFGANYQQRNKEWASDR